MSEPMLWWLVAGLAVTLELLTGTFYLLIIAGGLACGAIAAHLEQPVTLQIAVAALFSGVTVLGWHFYRRRLPAAGSAQANADANLDIGETVQIAQWSEDGTAQVHYRGAVWTVVHRPQSAGTRPLPGLHRIAELSGNRLLVEKV